jgi:hypothetical protein
MKAKSSLIFIIAASVTASLGFWIYYVMEGSLALTDIFQFSVILILIVFALYIGIKRIQSERKGLPAEDELSKKVLSKAASSAFYLSLYMWLAISYLSDSKSMATQTWIGTGIVCMSLLFALSWIFHRIKGVNEA